MIDLHCHILPELDDGAKDWDESLAMCLIALKDGIHTIVATPHIKPGIYSPKKELILSKTKELNRLLKDKINSINSTNSMNSKNPVTLKILPGADIYFQPEIFNQLKEGTALFLGQPIDLDWAEPKNPMNPKNSRNSMNYFRYVLLELTDYFLFPQVKELIKELKGKGIIPILSHPERNMVIQRNSKLLYELIQAGALSQVTAMSVTGEFGREIQKITKKLITKDLVHIIASDAHSKDRRPPILSRAVKEAAKMIGTERAEMMVKEIPQAVLEGRMIE